MENSGNRYRWDLLFVAYVVREAKTCFPSQVTFAFKLLLLFQVMKEGNFYYKDVTDHPVRIYLFFLF